MANYATASKQWNKAALDQLPQERGFRLRGLEVTRLDTFVDAAFAFVLTILVISFDDIPANYDEMLESIKRIPGFLLSFITLMIFWLNHRAWSRRYGLENTPTLLISLAIIFVILVYVYPLRMVFESLFEWLSGGYFNSTFKVASMEELRVVFIYYSVGFMFMSLLSSLLFVISLRNRNALNLNAIELKSTQTEVGVWSCCAAIGLVSVVIATFASSHLVPLSGFVYFFIYPAIWLVEKAIISRQG